MPVSGTPKQIMETEMHKFKEGTLHSGKSKQPVKSRKQAIAIGMSEAGTSRRKTKSGNWKGF